MKISEKYFKFLIRKVYRLVTVFVTKFCNREAAGYNYWCFVISNWYENQAERLV
jgi:hypothetical protein